MVFVFVGPDVRGMGREFERAGPNVRWLGTVDNATRDSLLNACAILCAPSSRESFGSVIIEAWASGKPVVGGPAAATSEPFHHSARSETGSVCQRRIVSRVTALSAASRRWIRSARQGAAHPEPR